MVELSLAAVLALVVGVLFWKFYRPARPSNGMLEDNLDDDS
ncbi:hypothetical protein [Flaviflagellibacter deserti]|jgi:hypothetical protein|uniref:Cbb3-type cytochrome oxidase component FixQ n=1 Tax=Flaviflagellibacter deserti TaxID=2267266 RepID=A0ABV9YZJ5_9HYPH